MKQSSSSLSEAHLFPSLILLALSQEAFLPVPNNTMYAWSSSLRVPCSITLCWTSLLLLSSTPCFHVYAFGRSVNKARVWQGDCSQGLAQIQHKTCPVVIGFLCNQYVIYVRVDRLEFGPIVLASCELYMPSTLGISEVYGYYGRIRMYTVYL